MTCKKAQGFLDAKGCTVVETVDSSKQKIGPSEALELLDGVKTLVCIMRGNKVFTYDLTEEQPDDQTLLHQMIGPSGSLRAPTARIGSTLVVGFDEETYRKLLAT